jgi:hypothetical protein
MSIDAVIALVEKRIDTLARWLNRQREPHHQMQSEFTKLLTAYTKLIENEQDDGYSGELPSPYPSSGYDSIFGESSTARRKKPKLRLGSHDDYGEYAEGEEEEE